jgi:Tol biopolymer transport system component/DNA-binding winged helix-turn-helix (wHTH) protein
VQSSRETSIIRFGPFEVDLEQGVLRKHGVRLKLQAQPFQILAALLEKPGTPVTRDELRRRLWADDTFVDFEHGLNAAVTRLRQALGDSPEHPRYIETLAKRGYRFRAEVKEQDARNAQGTQKTAVPSRKSKVIRWIAVITTLAVVGAGAFFALSKRTAPPDGHAVPLTTFRGFEANPAISPDGRQVAFTWNGENQDNFDIYVVPFASGTPIRLTTDSADDVSPVWSPDGSTIAFLRRLSTERAQLVLVPAAGGPEHTLAETRERPWFLPRKPSSLAWSPDGHWIAASHREPADRCQGIYMFSLTGEKRVLTMPPSSFHSDQMPAFSPDGRGLAFSRLPGGYVAEIYLLPLDAKLRPAGEARRLTNYNRWSAQPAWTRDGRQILYVFGDEAGKAREIRIMNVAHPQTPARIVSLRDEVSEISLGRHLVYSRQTEDTNIWRAELPKNGVPPVSPELFISSTWIDQTPKYSPDGKKIAFASSRSGSREIWVSKADGSNPVRMTSFGGPIVGHPSWSHDGQLIVFHARPEGTTELFEIPAAGGPVKRLTTNNWEDHYPTYSRDGRSIFFSSRRSGEMQIWRMSTDGGNPTQITTSAPAHIAAESPGGRTLFFHVMRDPGEIWSVPVQGGQPVKMVGPTQRFPVGYTVTSAGIYYGAPPHAGQERFIRFFSFATHRSTPVVLAKHPFHSGMSVSPDSRYILFDQYDEEGSDLMLVENFSTR